MDYLLQNPYLDSSFGWLKGNLHTHTAQSDGGQPPQEIVDDYAARGYGFLMLSDHDKLTDPGTLKNRGMVLLLGYELSAQGRISCMWGRNGLSLPQKIVSRQSQESARKAVWPWSAILIGRNASTTVRRKSSRSGKVTLDWKYTTVSFAVCPARRWPPTAGTCCWAADAACGASPTTTAIAAKTWGGVEHGCVPGAHSWRGTGGPGRGIILHIHGRDHRDHRRARTHLARVRAERSTDRRGQRFWKTPNPSGLDHSDFSFARQRCL